MNAKKTITMVLLAALAVGIIVGVSAIIRENRITALRNEAASLCRQGRYEESMEIFSRFDDDTAKAWVKQCKQGIAERDALALSKAGKSAEAMAMLKEEYPESSLMDEIIAARAAELAGQGDAAAAVQLLEEENHPDQNLRETYAEAADEQAFWKILQEGDTQAALEKYQEIKNRHPYPSEDTKAKLSRMLQACRKAEAAALLENGKGFEAFKIYENWEDEEGMLAALNAMEASGDHVHAFRCLAEKEELDIARLSALYDRMTEPGYRTPDNAEFRHVNQSGQLEYSNLRIGPLLSKMLAMNDEAAEALAVRIADNIAAECRTMIDEGKRRSPAYKALGELKTWAGSLWTDELQALSDRSVGMPESGILSDPNGLERTPGTSGSASITVKNNSLSRGALLHLNKTGNPSKIINVFIRPDSSFAFTIDGGMYEGKIWTGKLWYGSEEYFGETGEIRDVEIQDSRGTATTMLQDGIYLLTIN